MNWRVSSTFTAPRLYETEHALDAAREYAQELECPRFSVLLVTAPGERRRFKVTNDERTTLVPLPPLGDMV